VHGLAKALVRRGHEVHVYTTNVDGDEDLDVQLGSPIEFEGVQIHYFPVPALRRLYWAPALGRRLRENMSQFDIVHLHSVYLWPTWAAARTARSCGVPYFISPRGMLVRDLIRKKSRWVKTAWIELIERHSVAAAAAIHVTSEVEATELEPLGLKARTVYCIGNGVEWPAEHSPLSAGPFARVPQPYALFLSRINWKKGLDRVIRAWNQVRELHLLVVGNDEEDYLPRLRTLAEEQGVADRVHFLGPASDAAKWSLYESASVFVLPSYSENFGNVVAEAMAMGCPVVVTPEVGLANLVREVGCGIVCGGDPALIADAINRLAGDTAMRETMGARGKVAIRERLSWDAVSQSMESAYRNAIAQAPPAVVDRDFSAPRGNGAARP
jgi:glycosyltransferase involved in cell wall biosynthesis